MIDVRDLYKWSCAAVLWLMTSMAVSAETLTAGMSGSAVADLQNALVQAGYLARTVDGDYGSTTKEAVFLFQKDHGLPATGKADDATIASIRRNENSGYRNGGGVVYASGNRGDVIVDMQLRLQKAGYLKGGIDGVYGQDTENAVRAYQKDHGFPVSGVIDEMTYNSLKGKSSQESAQARSNRPSRLYGIGDSGDRVLDIQNKLKKLGYLDGTVDGIYGGLTANAVKAFQGDQGISETGEIDEGTLDALSQAYADRPGDFSLALGDSGKKVILLQNKLLLHGYNPGTADGVYGQSTADAVKAFQAEQNLARTGSVDSNVWKRLDDPPRFTGNYIKVFHMEATAYTPNDGNGNGHTALGGFAGKGHAAVDPNVIPLGSIVFIEGYGYAICDDIGGVIHGMIIDVGVDTLDQAYAWGTKPRVTVYLIK